MAHNYYLTHDDLAVGPFSDEDRTDMDACARVPLRWLVLEADQDEHHERRSRAVRLSRLLWGPLLVALFLDVADKAHVRVWDVLVAVLGSVAIALVWATGPHARGR